MRKILLIGTVLVLPMNAMAQTAADTAAQTAQSAADTAAQAAQTAAETTAQTAQSVAEAVTTATDDDGYRVAAIAVGAVAVVIVANYLTAGLMTPVLLAGSSDLGVVAATSTAATAVIGGYIGDWAYSN